MTMAFLLFIVSCLCIVSVTQGTSCYPSHPQKAVCDAHYVIRGRYMETIRPALPQRSDVAEDGTTRRRGARPPVASGPDYNFAPSVIRIRLEKVYKGILVVNASAGQDVFITVVAMEQMNFKTERLYLFTGFSTGGKLYTSICHWNPIWEDVTLAQRFGLKRYYWMYCQCRIRFCPNGSCAPSTRACNWDLPMSEIGATRKDCHSKYNICVAKGSKCIWYSPKGNVNCRGSLLP